MIDRLLHAAHGTRGAPSATSQVITGVFAMIPLLAACYTYTPIETAAARPGMSVRARVSAAAGERIAPLLGTSDARLLSGTLIGDGGGPDTMIVEVPTVARADAGGVVQTLHQRVSIPRAELLELEMRKLDRFRTGAFAGAAAVIVGTVVFRALRGGPGAERPPGGDGTDALVPLFRRVW